MRDKRFLARRIGSYPYFFVGVTLTLLFAVGFITHLVAQQQPSREYIRFGNQVVAIENPSSISSVTLTAPSFTIGALDLLQISETSTGCTSSCTPTWMVSGSGASISSSGLLTPVPTITAIASVNVTATVGGVTSAPLPIVIEPVPLPAAATVASSGAQAQQFQVTSVTTWTAQSIRRVL